MSVSQSVSHNLFTHHIIRYPIVLIPPPSFHAYRTVSFTPDQYDRTVYRYIEHHRRSEESSFIDISRSRGGSVMQL